MAAGATNQFTVTFTAPNITTGLTVTSTISSTTPESNTANNTATVVSSPVRSLQFNTLTAVCVNDVPYLQYNISTVNFTDTVATITFVKPVGATGTPTYAYGSQPLSTVAPGLLWPEAAVDGGGRGVAWPGWTFDGTTWLYDANNGLRPTVTLIVSVNPTITTSVSYPLATPACVSGGSPNVDMVTTVQLASGTSGGTSTGTVTYSNAGAVTATGVTATLQLTPGLTSVTVTASGTVTAAYSSATGVVTLAGIPAIMPAGQTLTLSLQVTAPPAITAVQATSTISGTLPDTNTANNTATAVVGSSQADVSVTISLPASASPNSVVAGTVVFHNTGNTQADNVTRTVILSGGTLTAVTGGTIAAGSVTATFPIANLPAGTSASFTFTYAVPAAGNVSATASIATSTTETNTANNVTTGVTFVGTAPPDLSVSLAVSPNPLTAGTNTVIVTVANVSGMASTGTLTVSLPNGATVGFTIATALSAGQTVSFSTTYSVPLLTTTAQTFSAIVTATTAPDINLPNNTTTLVATVGATLRGLAWIDSNRDRVYQAGEVLLPNLLVRLYNAGSVVVGTAMTGADGRYEIKGMLPGVGYRVEFYNCMTVGAAATCNAINTTPYNQAGTTTGGQPSTGVTATTTSATGEAIGQAITGITLYAGDNTVDQNLPLDPRGQVYDSVTRLPVAGATVRLNGPVGFNPATHLLDLNGAQPNNESTSDVNGLYQFIFINNPPAGVYTLNVVTAPAGYVTTPAVLGGVALPNVIANVPTSPYVVPNAATNMQPGYGAPGTPPVGVTGSAAVGAAGTQYVMTASFAFGVGYLGEVFNNNIPLDATAGGGGGGGIDLAIVKTGPAVIPAGGTGTYTLRVTNSGPTVAANANVTDVMPAGLTLLSATVEPVNALTLSVTPTGLAATTPGLAVGVSTVTLIVRAEPSAAGTTVTNVASVATSTTETDATNNSSSASTFIPGTDLSISKQGSATMAAGATASYVLNISNAGPSTASNVTVTDVLPAGLTLVSASVVSGSFTLVTTTAGLTALAGNMPVGAASIALTVNVGDTVIGTLTNVAGVTSTTPDLQPSNNTGSATSGILGADMGILKFGSPSISAAGTATYTLVVFNNGPSSAGNVTVTDVMPTGLTLIGAVASNGSLTLELTPDKLVATAGVMRIGTTATVTLTVQAAYTATGTITNLASVTSTTPDPTVTNNIGTASSTVKEVEPGVILVNKTGNKTVAEVGDSVQYTIRMRNTIGLPVTRITLEDLLPAGFRYILGTARLNGTALADPAGGVGRQLVFDIGTIPGSTVYELTYFVRLGVGSQQGDGVNRATAIFPGALGTPIRSNTAIFKVNVQGGVFSNEGCIVGKVYVDCDGNSAQNNEGGSRELGIPGVRLVMLDGTFIVTDNEGKYSLCGVKPQTHVIKVDKTTLPRGARLLPSSNRNAGVGDSIFVEMRGGELHRADFIEGSCSPEVLEQVKARRAQGGVNLPEADKLLPPVTPGSSPGTLTTPAPVQKGVIQ
ncbi:MAG: DUF11 domain-containing protein [Ramlibacter sp.]|nr:DUF11 domain-containing protein [Ramlibacter sp.]